MKWQQDDLSKYVTAKEYIDTILLPLHPFQLSNEDELVKHAYQSDVLTIFIDELERELSGRTMKIPPYTYLDTEDKQNELPRINTWIKDIQTQPFQHIFFITFDMKWKKYERSLQGQLIWLPVIQVDNIQDAELKHWMRENVLQVSELIRSYW
ncbi:MAG TPA: DUF2487 family protein [Cerasibacillus sp.]|uniref:DUF2487 family protein n=1 Tax=Cerasibacillus sp. TaxID=2498711 RepID=UPI002F3F452E